MLSTDAARITAARLSDLGYPLITWPVQYSPATGDFDSFIRNHPRGFIAIPAPRALGSQGMLCDWAVTVDAAARDERTARAVAEAIQARLISLPRLVTGYEFLGDTPVGVSARGFKYVLTFMAHLRQGE